MGSPRAEESSDVGRIIREQVKRLPLSFTHGRLSRERVDRLLSVPRVLSFSCALTQPSRVDG